MCIAREASFRTRRDENVIVGCECFCHSNGGTGSALMYIGDRLPCTTMRFVQ